MNELIFIFEQNIDYNTFPTTLKLNKVNLRCLQYAVNSLAQSHTGRSIGNFTRNTP